MDGVAQVNALKGCGWLLLPFPPISPVPISPPLNRASYREAPNYRGSSNNRSISGSKVNMQVALNSFEALKCVLGKTQRLVYEY